MPPCSFNNICKTDDRNGQQRPYLESIKPLMSHNIELLSLLIFDSSNIILRDSRWLCASIYPHLLLCGLMVDTNVAHLQKFPFCYKSIWAHHKCIFSSLHLHQHGISYHRYFALKLCLCIALLYCDTCAHTHYAIMAAAIRSAST